MKTDVILKGDCIEQMKTLPDNSVDAIITDPPYGLEFMGKEWDGFKTMNGYQKFSLIWSKEALRVLKPGGYLLSFGGTRTYHRMACGIEDAGFEIRDCIMWLYGSGFPKSLNIGKQIDKIQGNEREVVGKGNPMKSLGVMHDDEWKSDNNYNNTKGNTEWEGWGTALKPAVEPIVVARKPLSEKNVALNVLKWGTGGINIDDCRIEGESWGTRPNTNKMKYGGSSFNESKTINIGGEFNQQGRFPANIILDEEAGKLLDEQSGVSLSKGGQSFSKTSDIYGEYSNDRTIKGCGFNDEGGASRFFYCPKASKSERNLGCEGLEERNIDYGERKGQNNSTHRPDGSKRKPNVSKNNHPTVKPIKLMEYLIKLTTKPNAIVLDPFLGSGTTAIACKKLNRQYIGIEKEEEYIKIAKARLSAEIQKVLE